MAIAALCLSASPTLGLPAAIAPQDTAPDASPGQELLFHFDPVLSEANRQHLLTQAGLEIIRPLRFADSIYLVRSQTAADATWLAQTHRLSQASGVRSVEPNLSLARLPAMGNAATSVSGVTESPSDSLSADELLHRAWHLDSTPYRGNILPRTDIRAKEAWEKGQRDKGVKVAVIDSTIQVDHPDLINRLDCLSEPLADALPGETCGWDFAEEDGDTRLSPPEVNTLRTTLSHSFCLSDRQLLDTYPLLAGELGSLPEAEKARLIRDRLQKQVSSTFHGTWAAGLIAAQADQGQGLMGVAPEATLLPIRVFDLEGNTTTARLIEATGYAAARGAEVVNLSFGSLVPSEVLVYHLLQVMAAYPNLVIVAAAGNDSLDGAAFPAAIPGVVAVGATTVEGQRAPYSQYGGQLDVVAPGGSLQPTTSGGILTTGGTWVEALWQGLPMPTQPWGYGLDPKGYYVRVQGTSFASPIVAGVVALMKGEDPHRQLNRDQLIEILKTTAGYEGLTLSEADRLHYQVQKALGFGTVLDFPYARPSGLYPRPTAIDPEAYHFGAGLVDAARAVDEVRSRQ